jgi:hypothetical protein
MPRTVTLAKPERGEFAARTAVSTGESYVNTALKEPCATLVIVTAMSMAAPTPLADNARTDVCDTQTATDAYCPRPTLAVTSVPPKLKPASDTVEPDLAGPFLVPTELISGESKVNADGRHPTAFATVTPMASALPAPAGTEHEMEVSDDHEEVEHPNWPTDTLDV